MGNRRKIVVIGAGLAGLAAAYHLNKHAQSVIVLESSERVGGRVRTEKDNGRIIDAGAQFLSDGYTHLMALIKEIGLSSQLIEVSPYSAVVKNGKPRRIRNSKPLTLVSSGLISLPTWINFSRLCLCASLSTRNLSLSDYSAWHKEDNQNTPEWSKHEFGQEIYDYIVEPALEGFYFQSPLNTSRALPMAISMFPIRQQKIFTLVGGLETFPAAMSQTLDVRLNSPVTKIEILKNKIVVTSQESIIEADYIVLATPAPIARTLYLQANELEQKLMNTEYSATINIAIGTRKALSSSWTKDVYGFLIPGIERNTVASVTIESNKCRDRTSQGELLNIMLSDKAGSDLISKSDSEILAAIMPELELYFPGLSDDMIFTRIYRWHLAGPRSSIGRSSLIYNYRKRKKRPRLLLAGDYLSMPYTEGAVESGLWAAKQILNQ